MELVWQSAEMAYIRRIHLILVFDWPLQAQEIKYIERNFVQQRTELCHPRRRRRNAKMPNVKVALAVACREAIE